MVQHVLKGYSFGANPASKEALPKRYAVTDLPLRIDISPRSPNKPHPFNNCFYSNPDSSWAFKPQVKTLVEKFAPDVVLSSDMAPVLVDNFITTLFEEKYVFSEMIKDNKSKGEYVSVGTTNRIDTKDTKSIGSLQKMANEWRHPSLFNNDTVTIKYYSPLDSVPFNKRFKEYCKDSSFSKGYYVHPFIREVKGSNGKAHEIILGIFLFYPFNQFVNEHEGDWERVSVVLHSRNGHLVSSEEINDLINNPENAYIDRVEYYFHHKWYSDTTYSASEQKKPEIYVGGYTAELAIPFLALKNDSHGSFPSAGFYRDVAPFVNELVRKERTILSDSLEIELMPDIDKVNVEDIEQIKKWFWLCIDAYWGYPALVFGPKIPVLGWAIKRLKDNASKLVDIGVRSPRGPAFNSTYNSVGPKRDYLPYNLRYKKASFIDFIKSAEIMYPVGSELNGNPGNYFGREKRDTKENSSFNGLHLNFQWPRAVVVPKTNVIFYPEISIFYRNIIKPLNPFIYKDKLPIGEPDKDGYQDYVYGEWRVSTLLNDTTYSRSGIDVLKANMTHFSHWGIMAGLKFNLLTLRDDKFQMSMRVRSGIMQEKSYYHILRYSNAGDSNFWKKNEGIREQSSYESFKRISFPKQFYSVSELMFNISFPPIHLIFIRPKLEFGWQFYDFPFDKYKPVEVKVGFSFCKK